MAFRLFHGRDGVVPLSGRSFTRTDISETDTVPQFNPLAAKAATISLSAFGPGGPFNFDSFSNKWKKLNKKSSNHESSSRVNLFVSFLPIYSLIQYVGFHIFCKMPPYDVHHLNTVWILNNLELCYCYK